MRETFSELLYVIWAVWVTAMCLVGFFKDPGIEKFMLALFVWVVLIMLPDILRGK